jgi:hypothetical protein
MDAPQQTRSCERDRVADSGKPPRGSRQICIPMTREQYDVIWDDPAAVRNYLDSLIEEHPEIFPPSASSGYQLHGRLPESKKLPGIRLRQIRMADGVFTVRPSFVFAYMTGTMDDLENPLLLLAVRTPVWVVTQIFGKNDMFWQRLLERMGRNSLVGTTVRVAEQMPEHCAADEHHLKWRGTKGFLAMVAAKGCILAAALTKAADEKHLSEAYGVFDREARDVDPDWQPKSVNTDGWKATRKSIIGLFPKVVLVLCFLHGFLKIRDRCRKDHSLHERVWDVYRAETETDFRSGLQELKQWSETQELRGPVQTALEKLFARTDDYATSYTEPDGYRTSNQVDRPMNRIGRSLYASRGLHGHQATSERRLRALCLLENFRPFAPRSNTPREHQSPAHRLNNKTYHSNWLHNLQTSASLQGFHQRT